MVEIGDSDGLRKSNAWLFEEQGWQGIAIKPDPVPFETLERVRKCKVLKITVVARFSFFPWRLLGRVGRGISERSTSITQALKAPKSFLQSICIVRSKKLSIILENYDAAREINFISLDTEGGELRMLQETLTAGYTIDLILTEASTERIRRVIRRCGTMRPSIPTQSLQLDHFCDCRLFVYAPRYSQQSLII